MMPDKLSDDRDADGMPMSERRPRPPIVNESRFLADQATDARAAAARSMADIQETLKSIVDVRAYAARHPWIVTGSAAAAGVVAGAMLRPSRDTRSRSRRKSKSRVEAAAHRSDAAPETPPAVKPFSFSIVGTVLAAVLPPLLQFFLAPSDAPASDPQRDTPSRDASPAPAVAENGC